ncbi:MAG: polyprenyl synthetase family protein [Anaerolineae bacterium]|nr:polyprenyl synthetase family protein [Anaerolineae bacterium]
MSEINQIVAKYATEIDDTIRSLVNESPYLMRGIISYHFGWVDENFQPANFSRGKMLRPVINLLVYEAITGSYQAALPVAASIEIVHNFSLLHDDIEDDDIERRGRPTAWTIWGKPAVINVGDHLYSLAYKALHRLDPKQIPVESILAVNRIVNDTCLKLTEGQDLDLQFETLHDVTTEMYLEMVYKKTGALIEAAILAGARLATSDEHIIQNYYDFAHSIGLAFQIRDDVLGIWGDSAKTGKSVVNDLRRKKKTLPVIYMLDQTTGERKEKLQTLYIDPEPLSDPQIEFVRECLELVHAKNYAQEIADNYKQKSFDALDRIGTLNQAQIDLKTITEFLINRLY